VLENILASVSSSWVKFFTRVRGLEFITLCGCEKSLVFEIKNSIISWKALFERCLSLKFVVHFGLTCLLLANWIRLWRTKALIHNVDFLKH